MVAHFLSGVIVGLLIGLALAPFLRSWILWRQAKEWGERDSAISGSPVAGDEI